MAAGIWWPGTALQARAVTLPQQRQSLAGSHINSMSRREDPAPQDPKVVRAVARQGCQGLAPGVQVAAAPSRG